MTARRTPAALLATALAGAALPAGCALVFGLDEPTVDEGSGGGASGTTTSTGGSIASSGTSPGSGGDASSSGDPAGSTGSGPECVAGDPCDDGEPCTIDACEDGRCTHLPVADGPLDDDPTDCVDVTCSGGEGDAVADDLEDPPDANPPCELTFCSGGVPTPDYAVAGTSCGPEPQVCDGSGLCVGCEPARPDACGVSTECAEPTCMAPGVCDPGFLDASTVLTDPVDGDCATRACTGSSPTAVEVADDSDTPSFLPCASRSCSGGEIVTTRIELGMPCIGDAGVCDGLGDGGASCVTCLDTSLTLQDAGCTAGTPHCVEDQGSEGACHECSVDTHCNGLDVGDDCLGSYVCGCNSPADCDGSENGRECVGDSCGCLGNFDCSASNRGERCMATICGCSGAGDCGGSNWGNECIAGTCGCNVQTDCEGGLDCNVMTHRCE